MRTRLFLTTLVVFLIPFGVAAQTPTPASSVEKLTPLQDARQRGDWERLRRLAYENDDARALAQRAEIAVMDAEIDRARRFAEAAVARAKDEDALARATVVLARVEQIEGDWDAAEKRLRELLGDQPQAHAVRLELGRLLMQRGSRAEAEVILNALSTFFNNSLLKTSEDLIRLSMAMALVGSYQDANYAMERAIERNARNANALVHWGDLLLSKYNTADAEVTYKEALQINERHAGALIGLARTELELSNDYNKVGAYLDRAADVLPKHPELLLTRARVAIYDTDCERARELADNILEERPHHLRALTIRAACHYLADDVDAWKETKKKVLSLNPRYADLLTETAEYAVRVHRYEEAVAMNREALELRENYPPALLGVAIGLSRTGREDEAFDYMRRAFDHDPYNVRAYNMVELYEKQMPDYEFTEYDGFRLRAHRSENEEINHFVAPLVREAYEVFSDKYDMEPADYLAVEIFRNPTTFAVRSVGLPHVTPHGICFGKVVVSRSPSEGNFNWRQVLWHEMAHVFHIQMSDSRVPRWFTEGLAEYETNIKDPAWARHHDRELARALNAGNLRGVADLSKGFTHARSFEGIVRAYHQSSLVIHYIAGEFGFDAIVDMLEAWGRHMSDAEVFEAVLGRTPEQLDAGFAKWLERRYLNFQNQLTVDLADLRQAEEIREQLDDEPTDGELWARYAVAKLRDGDVPGADDAIEEAIRHGKKDAEANAIATMYLYDRGRVKDAYEVGSRVLDAGRDSYDLRFLLGSAAMALEKVEEARIHFGAAVTLWHDGIDAWHALARIGDIQSDAELRHRSLGRIYELDQNDPLAARRYATHLRERGEPKAALEAAQRWVAIAPFDARSHRLVAETGLEAGRVRAAEAAWEALLMLRQSERRDILLAAIEALAAHGFDERARAWSHTATEAGVSKARIRKALNTD